MVRGELGMFGFVQLDAAGFNVLLHQVVNTNELHTFISEPLLQTKPGRIVGVASLRQEQILAFKFLVILHNAADNFLH
jgi:hypothetical protein